jgi:hypothetical protein
LVALKYTAKCKMKTDRQQEMEVVKELCLKFADENPSWGYGRIHGALANLGYEVCDTTVGNILRAAGIPPSEERMKKSTWTKRESAKMLLVPPMGSECNESGVHRSCARRDVNAGALWAA